VPARGGLSLPFPGGFGSPVDRHKDRSARSVLNRGIFCAKRAKLPSANAAGNPVLELSHRVEPVASAASVSAERRARKTPLPDPPPQGGRERWGSAQPRSTRILIGQCAFRRSAFPFCWRVILSENRKCTFRDHALSRKRILKDSLRGFVLVVRNTRMPRHRENAEACHSGAHRRCEPGIHNHDPGERMFCEDGGYGFRTRHCVAIRNDEMRNARRGTRLLSPLPARGERTICKPTGSRAFTRGTRYCPKWPVR
jgi:hypothetical protein